MKLSLVVSTLGRTDTFIKFFQSLEKQTVTDFELIIVDQNDDDRVLELINETKPAIEIKRIHAPGERGLSRGRNLGSSFAIGDVLLYPDDDCWYPSDFLEKGLRFIDENEADFVTGRASDESGRSINGRFEIEAQYINRENVWTTQIEWVCFFKKTVVDTLNGYDNGIGVGSSSRWQACEGQDFVLRALDKGFKGYFTPDLFGHHEELNIQNPDDAMRKKGAAYARGFGHVAKIHKYSVPFIFYWAARPWANVLRNALKLNFPAAVYAMGVSFGRLEGYFKSKATDAENHQKSTPLPDLQSAYKVQHIS